MKARITLVLDIECADMEEAREVATRSASDHVGVLKVDWSVAAIPRFSDPSPPVMMRRGEVIVNRPRKEFGDLVLRYIVKPWSEKREDVARKHVAILQAARYEDKIVLLMVDDRKHGTRSVSDDTYTRRA